MTRATAARAPAGGVGAVPLALVSTMGGFCNGFSFTIVGGAMARMQLHTRVTQLQQSLILTSVLLGGIVGLYVGAGWLRKHGRRPTTFVGEFFVFTFGLTQAFVSMPRTLIVVRLLMGFGTGICILAKPLLVGELAAPEQRGTLVGAFSWAFSTGILSAIVLDSLLPPKAAGVWQLEVAVVPVVTSSILILLMLFFIPESPYFNPDTKPKIQPPPRPRAGCAGWARKKSVLCTIESEDSGRMTWMNVGSLVGSDRDDGKSLRVSLMLILGYQGTGMGLIMTLSRQLLTLSALDKHLVPAFNVAVGAVHFGGACVGVGCIAFCSRRRQVFTSLGCTTLACLVACGLWTLDVLGPGSELLAIARATSLLLVVFSFQCGLAPLFWVISSEIFTLEHRAQLMSLTYSLVFLLNMVNIGVGPLMTTRRRVAVVFLLCHLNGMLSLCYLFNRLPETANKALGNMWAAGHEPKPRGTKSKSSPPTSPPPSRTNTDTSRIARGAASESTHETSAHTPEHTSVIDEQTRLL